MASNMHNDNLLDFVDNYSSRHVSNKCSRPRREGSASHLSDADNERGSPSRSRRSRNSPCNTTCCDSSGSGYGLQKHTGNDFPAAGYGVHMHAGSFCHDSGQQVDGSVLLLRKLSALYADEEISDLTLQVGPHIYYVHKLILCISSDVFRVMLTRPEWPESQNKIITLCEESACIKVFERFLRFLYTGEVKLCHEDVLFVLMLADKYNVTDLRLICTQFMSTHIVSTVRQNRAVSWYQYARLCGHNQLADICMNFIRCNFYKVMCTADFLNLEKDILIDLLQDNELVIKDEYTLYKGTLYWLSNYEPEMQSEIDDSWEREILSHIRFSLMPLEQLSHIASDPLAIPQIELIAERLAKATDFHRRPAGASCTGEHYTPRNYTSETWATRFAIDNFCSVSPHEVRPLFFSSPLSASEADDSRCWEWHVDVYPKGVHFQRCILIGFWRNLDIQGTLYNTVRLTLSSMVPEVRVVDVIVLVTAVQDGIEYVSGMVQRRCCFDALTQMVQINDLIGYEELNSSCSPFLSGTDGNSFQITIIIKPVSR